MMNGMWRCILLGFMCMYNVQARFCTPPEILRFSDAQLRIAVSAAQCGRPDCDACYDLLDEVKDMIVPDCADPSGIFLSVM